MTLLIVDDSPLIIAKMEELLEDIHCITTIKSCGTYEDAVELLLRCKPQVVLLDINLPDKNGIALLRYIKMQYPQTHVIMVTNHNNEFYKNLCIELGALRYVDKSNDFEQIADFIEALC